MTVVANDCFNHWLSQVESTTCNCTPVDSATIALIDSTNPVQHPILVEPSPGQLVCSVHNKLAVTAWHAMLGSALPASEDPAPWSPVLGPSNG